MSEIENDSEVHKPKISILTGAMVLAVSLFVFALLFRPPVPPKRRLVTEQCNHKLHQLAVVMLMYAEDNDEKRPAVDGWCDLLVQSHNECKDLFLCPGALRRGDKGPCHYAINPDCRSSSPGDTVLLFEAKGGWNQRGGPEILTTQNHNGKGCNVLFNDGSVRYVRPEELGELKWKAEEAEK
jgi:prepilin-type processing-associated H-X9-DG protein